MPHARSRKRKKAPKRVLALPDLEHAKSAVLSSLTSRRGQRTYDHAIREFVAWYCSEPRLAFNRAVVLRYRILPGAATLRAGHDQSASRRGSPPCVRGGRRRAPQPGAGGRHPPGKGVRRVGIRL